MKTKKESEKALPLIVLKYHRRPSEVKDDKRPPSGITCAYCRTKNIVDISGRFRDKKGKEQFFCEHCAVEMYKEELGFRTLKAAHAHRRRIFDVGYLLSEIITDEYMKLHGFHAFDDIGDKITDINEVTRNLWNYLFSKEEKLRIEAIEKQTEIEAELKKALKIVDLEMLFAKIDR